MVAICGGVSSTEMSENLAKQRQVILHEKEMSCLALSTIIFIFISCVTVLVVNWSVVEVRRLDGEVKNLRSHIEKLQKVVDKNFENSYGGGKKKLPLEEIDGMSLLKKQCWSLLHPPCKMTGNSKEEVEVSSWSIEKEMFVHTII